MGPAVNSYEKIVELIEAGMNVARINFSHGTYEEHKKTIDLLKKARSDLGIPLGIMLDTKGPEIRVGILSTPRPVAEKALLILSDEKTASGEELPVSPGIALEPLSVGDLVLFDDGYISSRVVEKKRGKVVVEILNKGVIKSRKGINMPNVDVPLPALTEQDIADIKFGCEQNIDCIAASFIRSADHVREIKELLFEQGKGDTLVFAKIENSTGVKNFDTILQVADGIMVARGDLGVELPIEQVPLLQKMMIRKCHHAAKTCITATQMLESMIENPRPTRAEASDVANAVYDSSSAIMLSGETAVGKYPIETVRLMHRIVVAAEADFPFLDFFDRNARVGSYDISTSISLASVKTAYSSGAKAIFAFTSTGTTARMISKFRPEMPIIALTPYEKTYHQLSIAWGVIPATPRATSTVQEGVNVTSAFARVHGLLEFGDLVVITAGSPFGMTGTTNTMIVESIGEVLVRGQIYDLPEVSGLVFIALTPDTLAAKRASGKIVVLPSYSDPYLPLIKNAKGVILQNHPQDTKSEEEALEACKALSIPLITRADGALRRLQDGQAITLDPRKGAVYKKASGSPPKAND